jgi:ribose transport system substrate-binding protein
MRQQSRRWLRLTVVPAVGAAMVMSLSSVASASPATSLRVQPQSNIVTQAEAAVMAATKWPTTWPGPTAPTTPQDKGGKFVVISCDQATACALEVAGVVQAAKAIGWDMQVVDGKGDAGITSAAIRNAVVDGAKGIILASVSLGVVTSALAFAKAHHVPVLNNAANTPQQEGINPTLVAGSNPDPDAYRGMITADWMIWNSGGKARVVMFKSPDAGLLTRDDGTIAQLKKCPACQVLTAINASFSVTTTPQMTTEINSILDRYPTVQYIRTPYSAADAFAVPALQTRGRTDVQLISDSPTSLQMQDCYQGKNIGAVYGDNLNWVGWEAVDEMNRIIQHPGVTPPPENTPWVILLSPAKRYWAAGQTTPLPAAATCPANGNFANALTLNFQSEYMKLWGLG